MNQSETASWRGRDLSRPTMALLAACVALALIDFGLAHSSLGLVRRFIEKKSLEVAEFGAQMGRMQVFGVLNILVRLSTAVCFSLWFLDAYRSLFSLGRTRLSYRPSLAAWGFYIPIVNLIVPYDIAQEIWASSAIPPSSGGSRAASSTPLWLSGWWIAFLAFLFSSGLSGIQGGLAHWTAIDQGIAMSLREATDVLGVIAGVLAILFIRRVVARQEAAHRFRDRARADSRTVPAAFVRPVALLPGTLSLDEILRSPAVCFAVALAIGYGARGLARRAWIVTAPGQGSAVASARPGASGTDIAAAQRPLSLASGPQLSAQEIFQKVAASVFVVEAHHGGLGSEQGSAVAIAPELIVTNYHVVAGDRLFLRVTHQNLIWDNGKLLYADPDRDLAAIQVPGLNATPVPIRYSDDVQVGEHAYAIGAPQGLELSLSEGLISGFRFVAGNRVIQTTAPMSPGSSGGGLFDDRGRLVGITTFLLLGGENLNFALPAEWTTDLPLHPAKAEPGSPGAT